MNSRYRKFAPRPSSKKVSKQKACTTYVSDQRFARFLRTGNRFYSKPNGKFDHLCTIDFNNLENIFQMT